MYSPYRAVAMTTAFPDAYLRAFATITTSHAADA